MIYFKKYSGEIILSLCALSYSFEWFFIRELGIYKLSAFDIIVIRSFYTSIIITTIFFFFNRSLFSFKKITIKEFKFISSQSILILLCGICFNTAIKTTSVANTLVIFYLCIFWGALFGFLFLKEKITLKISLYSLLAFAGICLALLKSGNSLSLQLGKGELFAFAGSLLFPMDGVISRKLKHVNTMQRLFIINVLITIIGFIYVLIFLSPKYFLMLFSPDVLFYSFALAFFCGFIAKSLMYAGYNRTPVSIALVILLLEPIFQMITAFFIADEKISLINATGIFIVIIMVISISFQQLKLRSL